ncbi:MAG: cupin domain-containing protein [Alphaproteobacteria bacterium]|jgi:quercetin dioxygenase-like cupin family protein
MASHGVYTVDERVTVAEAPGLRVRRLTLAPGQTVPWHKHSTITDTFFCMDGPMVVETEAPDAVHVLAPGESLAVPPNQPHYVHGVEMGACRFMIVQGVGQYDYIATKPGSA